VILTKGKIRDPKIKSPIAAALIGCQLGKGHDVHGQPHTLKVNCVAAIFISERLVLSKSWTSNARHVGDQSLITALITLLIAVLEIKVSKKAKKKVVISLECIGLINLHLAAIHFSDAEMKRQLGILFTSRRASDI